MPSRLSIFSSRVLGSALIWTILAVVLIEMRNSRVLPPKLPSHEVDQLLYDLDHAAIPARNTVFLGDSVGRQVGVVLAKEHPDRLVSLASNAAIETPGQYYMYLRYLEHHPAPDRIILMMGHPLSGQARGPFTENYIQRGLLRWREIAELARVRRSLPFTLVMVGYKLSPTFRYRLGIQKKIPYLKTPNPYFGSFDLGKQDSEPAERKQYGLLEILGNGLKRQKDEPAIGEIYFRRLAKRIEQQGIEWTYVLPPIPESSQADKGVAAQMQKIQHLAAEFPHLRVETNIVTFPSDWSRDGTHLRREYESDVAKRFTALLGLVSPEGGAP